MRALSFTGSTATGRLLMAQCAPTVKRLALELGGNAPFLVFDDADLDARDRGRARLQVPQHRADVRVREPLPGAGRHLRRVRGAAHRARARAPGGRRARAGRAAGPADLGRRAREGGGARGRRAGAGREAAVRRPAPRRAAATSTSPPCSPRRRRRCAARARRPSARSRRCSASATRPRRSGSRTTPSSASRPTSTRATSGAPGASPRRSRSGMLGVNEGLISTEVAPFGGVKQSGLGREGSHAGHRRVRRAQVRADGRAERRARTARCRPRRCRGPPSRAGARSGCRCRSRCRSGERRGRRRRWRPAIGCT